MKKVATRSTPDPTFQLWQAFNEAASHARHARAAAAGPAESRVWPGQLQYLLQEAELTRLWDVPLDRAVRRLLVQCLVDHQAGGGSSFPESSVLERVFILRSGGMHVLNRLFDRLRQVRGDAMVHMLCHKKDIKAISDLWPKRNLQFHPYPRLEPFDTATLSRLVTEVPAEVQTAFYLDNDPHGMGAAVAHVGQALTSRGFQRLYVFNESAHVHEPHAARFSSADLDTLVQTLVRYWDRRVVNSL